VEQHFDVGLVDAAASRMAQFENSFLSARGVDAGFDEN
jgi:hypothetical protein